MKNSKGLIVALSTTIIILLCVSIGLSAFGLVRINSNSKAMDSYFGNADDPADEDGVVIAGRYTIESTKAISDAYISGDSSKLSDRDKETLEMAEKVLKKIIKKDMSDYKKEKAVYLYLVKTLKASEDVLTVISQNSSDNSDPHDVLKNKSAVCVGYATTFRMFMQMLGIECKVVHSTDMTHSWDLVKLEDDWYHTDCYMDSDGAIYANFNMDDTMCEVGHMWTKEHYPAAEGKKYNYILKSAKELDDIYDMPEYVAKKITKGAPLICCSFKSLDTEGQKAASYMGDTMCSYFSDDTSRSVTLSWTKTDDNTFIAVINVTSYDTGESIDDSVATKIDNLLSDIADKYGFEGFEEYEEGSNYDESNEYYEEEVKKV